MFNDDFLDFLYANGINRFEWRLLLDYSSDEALKILGTYSEQTFEKVMKTVNFLERRTNSTLEIINCTKNQMVSIFLEVPSTSNIDLLEFDSSYKPNIVNSLKSSKLISNYVKSREKDIFTLIESGYKVVDKMLFTQLSDLRLSQLN